MTMLQRAALEVYCLNKADQQWLLSHLPETNSRQIQHLLTELEQLGIPREQSVIAETLGASLLERSEEKNKCQQLLRDACQIDKESLAKCFSNDALTVRHIATYLTDLAKQSAGNPPYNDEQLVRLVAARYKVTPSVSEQILELLQSQFSKIIANRGAGVKAEQENRSMLGTGWFFLKPRSISWQR